MPCVGELKWGWGDHSLGAPLVLCESFLQESYLSQYLRETSTRIPSNTKPHTGLNKHICIQATDLPWCIWNWLWVTHCALYNVNPLTTATTLPYLGNGRKESLHMLSTEAVYPSIFNMQLIKIMDVGLHLWGAKMESTVRNNRVSIPNSL